MNAPIHSKFEQEVERSSYHALLFGQFLDRLTAPTPSQLWLERAAAQLRETRDPGAIKRGERAAMVTKLKARDGVGCWFCGNALGQDISIEHLTPLALQGSWADDNLALAHIRCNNAAGHLTRFEKERLREQMRANQPNSERLDR